MHLILLLFFFFFFFFAFRDDIEVVVANPKTAGVARWIFLALWGHKMSKGETAARKFVTKVFDNVEVMPRDAREASDVFYTQRFGDALLTYENEAVFTNLVVSPKAPLPFISPDNNVRITCPAALVDRNIDTSPPEVRQAAEAFINYLFTPSAQKEFVACGFRTTNKVAAAQGNAPRVKYVWEVEKKLGNWLTVQKKFFDDGVSFFFNCSLSHWFYSLPCRSLLWAGGEGKEEKRLFFGFLFFK
jgi:sulfate transport system substrate-binding protein